jgi:hypothetical protein
MDHILAGTNMIRDIARMTPGVRSDAGEVYLIGEESIVDSDWRGIFKASNLFSYMYVVFYSSESKAYSVTQYQELSLVTYLQEELPYGQE